MITPKQMEVYEFIKDFIFKQHYAPTMAEIAEAIGIKSRGVVHRHVQNLAEQGLLQIIPGKRRNIELTETQPSETNIPLLGKIAAGRPIEAVSTPETVDIAYALLGSNRYALKVQGESMIDEGILDGDLVICEYAETASNGEIVVALVENETATLKRFYNNNDGSVTLMPANSNLQPMKYPANSIVIQGIMVGLLRLSY